MAYGDWTTIEDCEGIKWSESGLALQVEHGGKYYWIPKSCIHDDSDCYKPDTEGTLKIPLDLAEEKELV